MKGVMIEELVSTYNFNVLTTEDIVLNYLPNKVANTVQTTHEIKELLTVIETRRKFIVITCLFKTLLLCET